MASDGWRLFFEVPLKVVAEHSVILELVWLGLWPMKPSLLSRGGYDDRSARRVMEITH